MEIKKREVLFSVIIALCMTCLGIFISGKISENAVQTAEKYATATVIDDTGKFLYGMDTDFGNALIYGEVTTKEPVTFEEIGNGYIYIQKVEEEYRKHTRRVTYEDSDGKKHTKTETYWTWDRMWTDDRHANTITFLDVEFPYNTFDMPECVLDLSEIGVDNQGNYIYTSSHVRYYYYITPLSMTGTVLANLRDGTMENTSSFYQNQTPDEVISEKQNAEKVSIIIFWVFWSLLIGGVIFGFLYLENRWLD